MIISIFKKNMNWIENLKKSDYTLIIILGVLIAIIIEIYSIRHNRWLYTESMPTISGIGISPLIQLSATSIIGLWLVKLIKIE